MQPARSPEPGLSWRYGTDGHGLAGDRRRAGPCLRRPRRSRGAYGLAATRRDERQIRAIRRAAGRLLSGRADLRGRLDRTGQGHRESDIVEARFVDIVPGLRVVQAVDFVSDDPAHAGTMTMTGRSPQSTPGPAWTSAPTTSPPESPRRITLPGSPPHWPTSPPTSSSKEARPDRDAGLARAACLSVSIQDGRLTRRPPTKNGP